MVGWAATATRATRTYITVTVMQRDQDRQRQRPARVLDLLARGRDASRPMYEKKMMPVAAVMPAKPNGAKSARLSEFQPVAPTNDEHDEHPDLDQHHHGVVLATRSRRGSAAART